jgi:hypothetical protein
MKFCLAFKRALVQWLLFCVFLRGDEFGGASQVVMADFGEGYGAQQVHGMDRSGNCTGI